MSPRKLVWSGFLFLMDGNLVNIIVKYIKYGHGLKHKFVNTKRIRYEIDHITCLAANNDQ